ncbi:aldo/keto reductase [Limobrevibacterium gyesilva]|uniref:Aldo/keto reductase n=1 Tax=Limobrevibacterium gyesilva TaxID=2991712 RepID=A0AA41YST5_9PROT|nr:aldo/keto reductase [Limobrevibacterium gyesilva]MCW3477907.1 aldo/keto reductase [Limobrevibacterium gyesilva]
MQTITAHGLRMPKLGLGTWRLKGEACTTAVLGALSRGYRHIDTAQMYGNEDAVGEAIAATPVPRADIHLTTKVWWDNLAPAAMQRAMETSLKLLKTDYVDLYLIHWPAPDMDLPAALGQLVAFKEQGLARNIGVSNFNTALLRRAVEEVQAPICCNQVEYHALLDQSKVLGYLRGKDMALTAYCPLAQGRLAEQPELAAIAAKHGATPAQVALKWLLDQDGVAAIPKAGRAESQQANLDALNLTLDDADRAIIAGLPKTTRFVAPAFAPAWDEAA